MPHRNEGKINVYEVHNEMLSRDREAARRYALELRQRPLGQAAVAQQDAVTQQATRAQQSALPTPSPSPPSTTLDPQQAARPQQSALPTPYPSLRPNPPLTTLDPQQLVNECMGNQDQTPDGPRASMSNLSAIPAVIDPRPIGTTVEGNLMQNMARGTLRASPSGLRPESTAFLPNSDRILNGPPVLSFQDAPAVSFQIPARRNAAIAICNPAEQNTSSAGPSTRGHSAQESQIHGLSRQENEARNNPVGAGYQLLASGSGSGTNSGMNAQIMPPPEIRYSAAASTWDNGMNTDLKHLDLVELYGGPNSTNPAGMGAQSMFPSAMNNYGSFNNPWEYQGIPPPDPTTPNSALNSRNQPLASFEPHVSNSSSPTVVNANPRDAIHHAHQRLNRAIGSSSNIISPELSEEDEAKWLIGHLEAFRVKIMGPAFADLKRVFDEAQATLAAGKQLSDKFLEEICNVLHLNDRDRTFVKSRKVNPMSTLLSTLQQADLSLQDLRHLQDLIRCRYDWKHAFVRFLADYPDPREKKNRGPGMRGLPPNARRAQILRMALQGHLKWILEEHPRYASRQWLMNYHPEECEKLDEIRSLLGAPDTRLRFRNTGFMRWLMEVMDYRRVPRLWTPDSAMPLQRWRAEHAVDMMIAYARRLIEEGQMEEADQYKVEAEFRQALPGYMSDITSLETRRGEARLSTPNVKKTEQAPKAGNGASTNNNNGRSTGRDQGPRSDNNNNSGFSRTQQQQQQQQQQRNPARSYTQQQRQQASNGNERNLYNQYNPYNNNSGPSNSRPQPQQPTNIANMAPHYNIDNSGPSHPQQQHLASNAANMAPPSNPNPNNSTNYYPLGPSSEYNNGKYKGKGKEKWPAN